MQATGVHDALRPSWMLGNVPNSDAFEDEVVDEDAVDMAKVLETEVFAETRTAKCLLAPRSLLGSAVEERHRVIQVCVGREHGILLNDAGIAFTWGDNTHGQLGRNLALSEENGQPFPVLSLAQEEILQVSAGTQHCLALVSPGLVWSWGRNGCGQLGVGDQTTRPRPVKVSHLHGRGREELQLGAAHGGRIVTISAGMHSSMAAGLDSSVWQWGEINAKFVKGKHRVDKHRPHNVCKPDMFLEGVRLPAKVSISETGCRVLDKGVVSNTERVADLVEGVRMHQDYINRERRSLAGFAKKQEDNHEEDDNVFTSLQNELNRLERKLKELEEDIEEYTSNLNVCYEQLARSGAGHLQLQQQINSIQTDKDKLSLQMKNGNQQDKLAKLETFGRATVHTQEAFVDLKADIDREIQGINTILEEKRQSRARLTARLRTVREFTQSAWALETEPSDTLVLNLRQLNEKVKQRLAACVQEGVDFDAFQRTIYEQLDILDDAEKQIKTTASHVVGGSNSARARLATMLTEQFSDIVDLRRSWCGLLQDRWVKDALDLSCFFSAAPKPKNFLEGDGGEASAASDMPKPIVQKMSL
eukprot:TRINITY_DN27168_c0_g1_i1.p1 TRINITY_DN27168_c0_g1~~TRINITY_DN27168_c0_g1_i1.p1  ORF type:complete len:588 (-),score=95.99 TRINITY_DN27168_c0_g1_i1:139-1902(-)